MFLTVDTNITIRAAAESVSDYACKPDNWTASNPTEHFQGTAPEMTGYKGFYYHFPDMTTGRRADLCELSTVDTSFLLAGMLAAAGYFDQVTGEYCLRCRLNLTFPHANDAGLGWTSPYHFGINLGPAVLMCENYRSELLWRLMRACPYVVTGLRRAGFTNGWL